MLYKVSPFGYFGRTVKNSQGPWFQHNIVEDDGLDQYYVFLVNGSYRYLLSNNISIRDREHLSNLYKHMYRAQNFAWLGGLIASLETVTRVAYFKKMAIGWRLLSFGALGYFYKSVFNVYNSQTYGPLFAAFYRKNTTAAKIDTFDITDRKREYFEIDTSQYMSYSYEELDNHFHANHGPQPDGEAQDNPWLIEVDKFLRGEESAMKEHKNYVDYKYEFIDKSFPSTEMVNDLFNAPEGPARQ